MKEQGDKLSIQIYAHEYVDEMKDDLLTSEETYSGRVPELVTDFDISSLELIEY